MWLARVASIPQSRFTHLLKQLVQSHINRCFTGFPDPLMSDHACVVNDVKRRRGRGIPLAVDVTFVVVVERSPVDFFLRHHFLEFARIMEPGIHSDEGEWFIF
jgi:hypothetical protein